MPIDYQEVGEYQQAQQESYALDGIKVKQQEEAD